MHPTLEAWSGVDLVKGQAYGVRVYQNGTVLVNHVDRPETHVISCILHIDHDLDEPWPIEIEDHDGKWHAVNLEPGEYLMYESAKQYHARLTPMRGRHYGSVFLHYYPAVEWNWSSWDIHVAVPPDFEDDLDNVSKTDIDLPPFLDYYNEYWKNRGVTTPPLRHGIQDPVQPVEDRGGLSKDLRRLVQEKGNVMVVEGLLQKRAEVNAEDENGWRPIHEAARTGDIGVVKMLVEHRADLTGITHSKKTALDLAQQHHTGLPFAHEFARLTRASAEL
jgi:hypothetical protein